MNFLIKIASLLGLGKKLLAYPNTLLARSGWVTYSGAAIIGLQALACLLMEINKLAPLDLNDLNRLAHSGCISNLGEAIGLVGIRRFAQNLIPTKSVV